MISRLISLFLFIAVVASAEPVATALPPGRPIPDVTVRSETGDEVKLRELMAGKPAVLIFYRGGWCPYCQKHLLGLASIEPDLQAAGVGLFAISMDQPSKLRETPNRDKLAYHLLSDCDAEAVQAFGIAYVADAATLAALQSYHIDIEAASGRNHHILPHPAVFVVDAKGVIRFTHADTDFKVRLDPAKILDAARQAAASK